MEDFAGSELSCSLTQLALAWCARNPHVSTVLLGATKTGQLEENLDSIKVLEKITPEHMNRIDEIMGTKPEPYMGFGGAGMRKLNTI